MVSTADMSGVNRLGHFMSEGLDPKWNEPSTRGDLRLLAIRIDTKFDQIRGDLRNISTEVDSKHEQLRGDFRVHATETDAKFDKFRDEFTRTMFRGGMIFSGAVITANLAMLAIFATLIR